MQVETPMRSESSSDRGIIEPSKDASQTGDNSEQEWLLIGRMQEPVVWPRVLPGL